MNRLAVPPIAKIQDLNFSYGRDPILEGLCLEIKAGQFVALVGPNGVGKSTALCCIAGAETLGGHSIEGQIELGGQRADLLSGTQRARIVSYLPQHLPADIELTVEELVWLGRHPHVGAFGRRKDEDRACVQGALRACDLQQLANRRVQTLSGGERQRAYLASALSNQPALLVLDEPTSALDLRHTLGLMQILAESDSAVLMATHDLNLAARFADSIAVLWDKKVIEQGLPDEILSPELIRTVYGVEVDTLRDPRTQRPVLIATERAR